MRSRTMYYAQSSHHHSISINEPERKVFKNFVSIYCELHIQMLLQGKYCTNITQMYSLVHLGCDSLLLQTINLIFTYVSTLKMGRARSSKTVTSYQTAWIHITAGSMFKYFCVLPVSSSERHLH